MHETTGAIVDKLLDKYIKFPNAGEQLQHLVNGFMKKCSVPQCAGAIDGSHIPVKPPIQNHTDYYNHKGWYSVIIQAVVDSEYLFRDINVGWPGSVHDARVYANSQFYQKVVEGNLLTGHSKIISGTDVPLYIIGDSAYPQSPFLMKPFEYNTTLSSDVKSYNYRLLEPELY